MTGSKAIDIINKDPKTILVVGSGTVTHGGIYSLGPIVLIGKTHIMGDIYSPKLVWLGLNVTLSSRVIGLPIVFSEEKLPHHNLGVTPYSAHEEINAIIALLKKHNHIKNALDKSKTVHNPFLKLSAKHQQHLRQEKIDIDTLKKYTALKVSQSYETIVNTDLHKLLVLDGDLRSSRIYSLGPIISYASLDSMDILLSASMVWSFTKPRSNRSTNDIKGAPLIFNP
ncbi:MAG TPA: hypothetical protein EYH35_00090 [Thiotrichaceae bacterium]|nr:hypothetical protein [Thiotrichaceae bacterium]